MKAKIETSLGKTSAQRANCLKGHYDKIRLVRGSAYWTGDRGYNPESDPFFRLITQLNTKEWEEIHDDHKLSHIHFYLCRGKGSSLVGMNQDHTKAYVWNDKQVNGSRPSQRVASMIPSQFALCRRSRSYANQYQVSYGSISFCMAALSANLLLKGS